MNCGVVSRWNRLKSNHSDAVRALDCGVVDPVDGID